VSVSQKRVGEFLRESVAYLAQNETRKRSEVIDHLRIALDPTPEEAHKDKRGRTEWENRYLWASVGLVKAGWITKNGAGVWAATSAGRDALQQYPESEPFRLAVAAAYQEWDSTHKGPRRRAWLVQGSSIAGRDLVPSWLEHAYCSLPASQLRPIDSGIDADQLRSIAEEDYSHLAMPERKAKIDEMVAFVTGINVGDVVLATSEQSVFLGDVGGTAKYENSQDGRSNLRRSVEWRNADAPVEFSDLPQPLPARLSTGNAVVNLTADLALIDSLVDPVAEDDSKPNERLLRHSELREPSAALANDVFVDLGWLSEVRSLLDERRQLIFYGPPGTGKTFIAQHLAADLVGPEQVKLVQFHPSYTYEDFFEGYRPVPGGAAGTIQFELRAGPFRQLVNRARDHQDQAFVLIIDEINRANLAKVFGELYFLLEYRDQAVDLLYASDEEGFTLPPNIYIIGTMNTADRSIALLDSAMRRRFAFVALDPSSEPTKSVLRKWSQHHGLGTLAAELLSELNRRIDDEDFRIGPSYFMTATGEAAHSPERLERTWRTSIIPLLEEHHYGEWESVRSRYQLASLLAAVEGGRAEADVEAAPPSDATASAGTGT
jgi:5-methylcytosine-specific restriction protein B